MCSGMSSSRPKSRERAAFMLEIDKAWILRDKIIYDLDKTPDLSQRSPHNCYKCGNPVYGHYCQGCALLQEKFKEDLFASCVENRILQNSFGPSNDNSNVANALQEPFVVNLDPGNNSSQSPPQISNHYCYGCGDPLEGIFCHQCTCKLCGNGAHYGYNCPLKVPIIPDSEPFNNQTIKELLPTVQSSDPKSDLVHNSPNVANLSTYPSKRFNSFCYDDDDDEDYTILITPNEPVNSLSMGDEHLDTILATESDEFIKSSVENLVLILSESEGESECDVPICEAFTTFSNILFDAENDFYSSDDQSFYDEDVPKKIYSNPLFDEKIIPMKIDPHHFNAESDLIESLLNNDSSIILSSKIDSLFDEFAGELTLLKSIPSGIDETDCYPEEETHFSRDFEDSDSLMKEIDLTFTPDYPMPSSIEDDNYDSERDILILKDLLSNDTLSLPEIESFYFDIPSFSRPPAKPPDGNTGILNVKIMGDISKQKVPMPKLMITLVPNQEKSPDLLSYQGLKAFQSCAKCPMMIHGKNTLILDNECLAAIRLYEPSPHWDTTWKFYIDRHIADSNRKIVRTHMRIPSVVSIKSFSRYWYDHLKEITLHRADYQEYTIVEKDFKSLYPSDLEDLNLLLLQGYELPPSLICFLCQTFQRFRRQASHTELFDQEVESFSWQGFGEDVSQLFRDSVYKHDTLYRFKMDKRKRFKLNLEIFRDILKICPRVQGQDFDALPTDEEIVSFLRDLGHTSLPDLPPKKVRKFKKPAFPKLTTVLVSTEAPTGKSKRVKRPAKKSTKTPERGVVIRETPKMPLFKEEGKGGCYSRSGYVTKTTPSVVKIKPSATSEGTSIKPRVLDVAKEESSKNNENELDSEHETDESKSGSESDHDESKENEEGDNKDETKITDKAKGDEDKKMDYTTSQLYDDVDIKLNEPVDTYEGFFQEEGTDAAVTNVQQGLKKSYDLDKTIFSTYGKVYSLKRSQKEKDEDPSVRSDRGMKKKKTGKDAESAKEELEFKVADSDMPHDQEENSGNDDKEPKEKASAKKPSKTFDELMSTLIDFSTFIMNGLNINNLTQEKLLGPAFRLLKGTCSNYAELEYDFKECYKALLEKLDWENPKSDDYPFDLTKPLPLVKIGNHQRYQLITSSTTISSICKEESRL
nr:hypothetical protein [Tanacetum cinerariifolium]